MLDDNTEYLSLSIQLCMKSLKVSGYRCLESPPEESVVALSQLKAFSVLETPVLFLLANCSFWDSVENLRTWVHEMVLGVFPHLENGKVGLNCF